MYHFLGFGFARLVVAFPHCVGWSSGWTHPAAHCLLGKGVSEIDSEPVDVYLKSPHRFVSHNDEHARDGDHSTWTVSQSSANLCFAPSLCLISGVVLRPVFADRALLTLGRRFVSAVHQFRLCACVLLSARDTTTFSSISARPTTNLRLCSRPASTRKSPRLFSFQETAPIILNQVKQGIWHRRSVAVPAVASQHGESVRPVQTKAFPGRSLIKSIMRETSGPKGFRPISPFSPPNHHHHLRIRTTILARLLSRPLGVGRSCRDRS